MTKENCSICFLELKEPGAGYRPITTRCSHCFHFECLFTWIYQKQSCPLCRQAITELNWEYVGRRVSDGAKMIIPGTWESLHVCYMCDELTPSVLCTECARLFRFCSVCDTIVPVNLHCRCSICVRCGCIRFNDGTCQCYNHSE
jgi:hypothetical protein